MKAVNSIWFIGDNFAATSYCKHFLLREDNNPDDESPSYVKSQYEYIPFFNSHFNSATANMLVRLQNTFAQAINKSAVLPKYILVILDDDLITYLDYPSTTGALQLLGKWVEWLIQQFCDLLQKKLELLPQRAKRDVCTYWSTVPTHHNFGFARNELRKKLNWCIESTMKGSRDT